MEKNLEEINRRCSKLTAGQIDALSDEEILELTVERPGHPGQFGFMLSREYFYSDQHFSETMSALLSRLGQLKRP